MLSSFEETVTGDTINEILKSPKIPLNQVESLEIKVKEYFQENILGRKRAGSIRQKHEKESFDKIQRYFSNLKAILTQVNKEKKEELDILYITNLNQFRKIKELIKDFEDFENKSKKFFEPLKQYLDTVNLFLKDSSKELYFDKNTSRLKFRILDKNFKSIIKPVEYIPESMFINDILNLLTKKRKNIALVIDEYGGTSGIITKEDIIEELFGEIEDEHDSLNFLENKLKENLFLFSARLEVDYLNDQYNLDIPVSDQYETLGGFIVHRNQDIPLIKEVLKIDQFEFKIKEVSNTKIETVELKVLN
jgi:CBS domain-containing protein